MNSVYPNLCQKLAEQNISKHELAVYLDLDDSTLDRKIQGLTPWLLTEGVRICILVQCNDADFLFRTDIINER